jgi:predicted nuclease with TOPRIM domain
MTEATNVIQISDLQAFVGIAAMLISVGAAWGSLKQNMKSLEENMSLFKSSIDRIDASLRDLRERFIIVEDRVNMLWKEKFSQTRIPEVT